jgi:hypothetical protein
MVVVMLSSLSRFAVVFSLAGDDDQLDEAMSSFGALATPISRRAQRRNVRSLTPSNSAASVWFSSADSQRASRFKNIAMRTR